MIVNLTPHDIVVAGNTFPASGTVARVSTVATELPPVFGCPAVRVEYGDISGLPDPHPGTVYIVSSMVLQAAPDRHDLVAPDTSPASAIRNDAGQVIGVKRFTVI